MSLQRLFYWTCDTCLTVVKRGAYGLPEGWIVVESNLRDGHGTLHSCNQECQSNCEILKKRQTHQNHETHHDPQKEDNPIQIPAATTSNP
jgi:nickel-dependent lactate racemase